MPMWFSETCPAARCNVTRSWKFLDEFPRDRHVGRGIAEKSLDCVWLVIITQHARARSRLQIRTRCVPRFRAYSLFLSLSSLVLWLAANNLYNTVYLSTGTSLLHYRHRSLLSAVPPYALGKSVSLAKRYLFITCPRGGLSEKTRDASLSH